MLAVGHRVHLHLTRGGQQLRQFPLQALRQARQKGGAAAEDHSLGEVAPQVHGAGGDGALHEAGHRGRVHAEEIGRVEEAFGAATAAVGEQGDGPAVVGSGVGFGGKWGLDFEEWGVWI